MVAVNQGRDCGRHVTPPQATNHPRHYPSRPRSLDARRRRALDHRCGSLCSLRSRTACSGRLPGGRVRSTVCAVLLQRRVPRTPVALVVRCPVCIDRWSQQQRSQIDTHGASTDPHQRSAYRDQRRGRDSNPRTRFPPLRDFQSRPFNRSGTSPCAYSPISSATAHQGYDTGARLVARLPAWYSPPAKLSSRRSA
jgi:hypothetical protein